MFEAFLPCFSHERESESTGESLANTLEMPSSLRAHQGSDPQKFDGTALKAVREVERDFAKSGCDADVASIGAIRSSNAPTSWRRYRNFTFFGRHHLRSREDFIRRQHPIHRN